MREDPDSFHFKMRHRWALTHFARQLQSHDLGWCQFPPEDLCSTGVSCSRSLGVCVLEISFCLKTLIFGSCAGCFMSAWHQPGAFGKRGTQLRNVSIGFTNPMYVCMYVCMYVGRSVVHFLFEARKMWVFEIRDKKGRDQKSVRKNGLFLRANLRSTFLDIIPAGISTAEYCRGECYWNDDHV